MIDCRSFMEIIHNLWGLSPSPPKINLFGCRIWNIFHPAPTAPFKFGYNFFKPCTSPGNVWERKMPSVLRGNCTLFLYPPTSLYWRDAARHPPGTLSQATKPTSENVADIWPGNKISTHELEVQSVLLWPQWQHLFPAETSVVIERLRRHGHLLKITTCVAFCNILVEIFLPGRLWKGEGYFSTAMLSKCN